MAGQSDLKHVLLTGATGMIGGALVPRLLADERTRLTLLVRAADDTALGVRAADMLAHWGLRPGSEPLHRLHLLRGDIVQPRFGLDTDVFNQVARDTSHIIHCAASVKLNMTMEAALATAVTPTRTVIELARIGAGAGRLQKVDLVSTVGVWGRMPGRLPERPVPEVTSFHNTYEAAKAEAERVVWAEGDNLPITVHRPSMVVGETGSGRALHFQVFYHLCEFLSGCRTFGVMPELGETRLDTIPVDWVADVIHWAHGQPGTAGQIFHLCTGPDAAVSLVDLQRLVRRTWAASDRMLPALRVLDRRWLERLVPLMGILAGARNRRALRGLSPVLAYLAEDQGFSNQATLSRLVMANLPLPMPQDYLETVLSFYLQQRRLGSAS